MPIKGINGGIGSKPLGYGLKVVEETPTDAEFNNTVLLLDGDGTNGGQNNTFVDSSSNNASITRASTPTQGTFNPFLGVGQYSTSFTAGGDRLFMGDSADFQFGTGDFTVELFVNFTTAANDKSMIDFRPTNGSYSDAFGFTITGTALKIFDTVNKGLGGTLSVNTWHHVVLQRVSGGLYAHVDGTATGTTVSYSVDLSNSSTKCTIGATTGSSTAQFDGFISSVRITKGTALYGTGNFTPPSSYLTTTSQGATASEVKVLTCQSNRYIDESNSGHSISTNGAPKVVAFSPFTPTASYSKSVHGGSGFFDGTDDYLQIADDLSTELTFGTGDFDVSVWLYPTSATGSRGVYEGRPGGNGNYPFMRLDALTPKYGVDLAGTPVNVNGNTACDINAWNFVTWSRVSGTTRIFLNGTQIGSAPDTKDLSSPGTGNYPYIGAGYAPGDYFPGYMCNYRVRKGVGVTSQTVPTAPLTNDSNTQLLLDFTNASIIDLTMNHNLITTGNAQISTSVKKFGTGSLAFDGTGDEIITGAITELASFHEGDFTVECFVQHTGTAKNETLISNRNSGGTDTMWSLHYFTTDNEPRWHTGLSEDGDPNFTTTPGTWHHLAVTRENGTHYFFIDGVQKDNWTTVRNYSQILHMSIGEDDHAGVLNGYLDSVRVTYGVARYSSSGFTPPTTAFPKQ